MIVGDLLLLATKHNLSGEMQQMLLRALEHCLPKLGLTLNSELTFHALLTVRYAVVGEYGKRWNGQIRPGLEVLNFGADWGIFEAFDQASPLGILYEWFWHIHMLWRQKYLASPEPDL